MAGAIVKIKATVPKSAPVCGKKYFETKRDDVEATIRRAACWNLNPERKDEPWEVPEFRKGITTMQLTWDTSDIIHFSKKYKDNPQENLLWRDGDGELKGILMYYPIDYPCGDKAGEFEVVVHPRYRRQGIATKLLAEAVRRWNIDLTKQRYTRDGAAFAKAFEARGATSLKASAAQS
jgi:GNAT superfamily N-acetyltransferase